MSILFNGGGAADTQVFIANYSAITSLTTLTLAIQTYRIGNGEGNAGRMFSKTGGFLGFKGGSNTYRFAADRWDTDGQWSIPEPSVNTWVHVAWTYDYGSTTNDPLGYLNGVSQTVTEQITPAGALNADTADLYLGNNNTGVRTWDGRLLNASIWDVVLTAAEVNALANGMSPLQIRGGNLVFYAPMFNITHLQELTTGTTMSTAGTLANADNPYVYMWGDRSQIIPPSAAAAPSPKRLTTLGIGNILVPPTIVGPLEWLRHRKNQIRRPE